MTTTVQPNSRHPAAPRALVVEHDLVTRHLLTDALRRRGHRVKTCADVETGWRACQDDVYPLIVLDWAPPDMDGLELCGRIRRLSCAGSTVILIQTAQGAPDDLRRVLEAGADDYLAKPYSGWDLELRLIVAEGQVRRASAVREAELVHREAARLEGARLAASTAGHHLGNHLALTVGYCHLLAGARGLSTDLRPLVDEALAGATLANETLEKLQRITRIRESDSIAGTALLDLTQSIEGEPT